MLFYWTMPRHREPIFLETVIDNTLQRINVALTGPIRNTALEYWLLDPRGQAETIFMTLLFSTLAWFIILEHSARAKNRVKATKSAGLDAAPTLAEQSPAPETNVRQPINNAPRNPGSETPVMKKLAPAGHRPTNAHLGVSPFHVRNPLAARAGEVAKPGYQTPFATYALGRGGPGGAGHGAVEREGNKEDGAGGNEEKLGARRSG
jgi:hypothetical protein